MADMSSSDGKAGAGYRKDSGLKRLMDAIHNNSTIMCDELMAKISARKINNLVRLSYPEFVGYTVTPLLWAVILGHHDIVELLLQHQVKVDKVGTYKSHGILQSFSPLLNAVQNFDSRMVNLLLQNGANVQLQVPGEKIDEEEGGWFQYSKFIFPLNACLGKDIDIFRMLLSHADMELEYGTEKHTCLCYAIKYLLKYDNVLNPTNLDFVVEVLNHGGRFCSGASFYPIIKMCSNLRVFMWNIICYKAPIEEIMLANFKKYICCLKLISCTDYTFKESVVYCCFKHLANLLAMKGKEPQHVRDDVLQIIEAAMAPSSLQHICRVAIRRYVKPFSRSHCERLNLPTRLLSYVMLENCL